MIGWESIRSDLQEMQARNQREREADLPRRLALMTPEATAHWSGVINRARPLAQKTDTPRPCHYGAWTAALARVERVYAEWPLFGPYPWPTDAGSLMSFTGMVGCPGWPDDHAHLVDFALLFIEADVMLFRSGYAKRDLLKRLLRADLDAVQAERAREIVRQAVVRGTGCEEFQQIRRLAARVADDDLVAWLEDNAEGAVLTLDNLDTPDYLRVFDVFEEPDLLKVVRLSWGWRATRDWGFSSMGSADLVNRADLPVDNRIRVNAWRILRLVDRIRGVERQGT